MNEAFEREMRQEKRLLSAIKEDEFDTVREMVTKNPSLVNGAFINKDPLEYAVKLKNVEMAKILLKELTVDMNGRYSRNILSTANESIPMMELLLASGADVNKRGTSGSAPIHDAIWRVLHGGDCRDVKELDFLLQHGADLNIPQRTGVFVLDILVDTYWTDNAAALVPYLIGKGARILVTNRERYNNYQVYERICWYELRLVVLSAGLPRIREKSIFPELSRAVLKRVCTFL